MSDVHSPVIGRDPRFQPPTSLASAGSTTDVMRAIADHAKFLHRLDMSVYAIEDGICVLVSSHGPVDTRLVSQAVGRIEPVSNDRVIAVPVVIDQRPVAVLSADCHVAGDYTLQYLDFFADVATAAIERIHATMQLEQAGVLQPETGVAPGLNHPTPFRALFDAANIYLTVCDAEGHLVYMNPYGLESTGVDPADYIGTRISDMPFAAGLMPDKGDLDEYYTRLARGQATNGEMTVRVKDGTNRICRFQLSPILDNDDNLRYVLISAIDITDQREAEYSLQRTNEALEAARAEAEKSANARGSFLANMSHEIRTPLNAIIGTTSLMLDAEAELTGEHGEILRSSAEHLLSVINDVLDISKLDTVKVDIDDDRFQVEALIESSLDLVMGSANDKGIEMTSIVEPGTPAYLLGDAPRVRQVLVNLLSNAVKYTQEGIVELICRGHYVGPDRVELVFDVRDTGPGIKPEELDTLFEPFVQAETRRLATEGTGLGLSISERLVRRMDGTITVQSTVGVGTTFTVSLPFEVDNSVHAAHPVAEPTNLIGTKVLIVDDHDINRRVLELETTRWGMIPTLCASPLDALALVEGGRRFDVALLDLNMPEMNGDELAAALRERNDCPRVLLSSTSYAGNDPTLFAARLHKPIKRHQLADAIEQALGHATAALSPPPSRAAADRSLRILVAEDNAVNQKVVRALLNRLGYTPGIVPDGLDVLKELQNTTYDLVLLDLRMPGIDGIETAAQIIENYGDDRPRLVALTASATEDDKRRCMAIGMDDFVTKPLTLDALSRVLAETEKLRLSRA